MPRYISVGGEHYGIWSNEDGTVKSDSVPTAKKTADVNTKISISQAEHVAQAKRK